MSQDNLDIIINTKEKITEYFEKHKNTTFPVVFGRCMPFTLNDSLYYSTWLSKKGSRFTHSVKLDNKLDESGFELSMVTERLKIRISPSDKVINFAEIITDKIQFLDDIVDSNIKECYLNKHNHILMIWTHNNEKIVITIKNEFSAVYNIKYTLKANYDDMLNNLDSWIQISESEFMYYYNNVTEYFMIVLSKCSQAIESKTTEKIEHKIINDVLNYKFDKSEIWIPYTQEELTNIISVHLENIKKLKGTIKEMENKKNKINVLST